MTRHRPGRRHPRRLFVTGGAGFLGRHIVNAPAAEGWEVVAPSSGALDLRHADLVRQMIADWRPTAVIHTAYRREDTDSIVAASRNVAEAAAHVDARLVHLSSDALFAGRAEAYTEADVPTPVHQYGADKADAEWLVASATPQAVIVRTSLLYDRAGTSLHEQAVHDVVSGRSHMSFFTDEVRSPVFVEDLAGVLLELAEHDDVNGVLHVGGPRAMSRAELARWAADRHGWNSTKLRFATIAESGLARPAHVVLDSSLAASHGWTPDGPG